MNTKKKKRHNNELTKACVLLKCLLNFVVLREQNENSSNFINKVQN